VSTATASVPYKAKDGQAGEGNDQTEPKSISLSVLPSLDAMTNRQLLWWMFRFLKPVKPLVFLACLWLAAWEATEILSSYQAGNVINQIQHLHTNATIGQQSFWAWLKSPDPDARTLLKLIGLLALLVAAMSIVRYLRETSNTRLSMTMVYYIREAVYDKLQHVGFAFHDVLSSGQLINRALTDLQNVRGFIQTAVLTTLDIILAVGGYMAVLFWVSKSVALLSLVPLPLWTWYIVRFGKKVQPASKAVMEASDKNVSVLAENIAGVHVIKAFATEKYEISKYRANCDNFFSVTIKRIRMYADFTPIIRAIASAAFLSIFFLSGVLILKGKLPAGYFLFVGSAMGAILNRLQQVATISDQYQNAIVSARRLYEVLMAPPTVKEADKRLQLPPGPGEVKFENVTFGYDATRPILKDISFCVPGGKMVAIVGPTGSGKTSLVSLIARFYDPQNGRILIDGADSQQVSLDSLRTQIAVVFQETYLFSDTVANNIAYGRPGVTMGDVEVAARLAQAHEFIEQLPKGYDAMLGERGASLSGGQRQRLAIARAILINPRILILDDATAAVDPETEDLIRKAMRFVMMGRTTFVIAHRISTVKRADIVVVLENGQITEMGSHKELMERAGHYREIAAAQLYGDEPLNKDDKGHMHRMLDEKTVAVGLAAAKDRVEREAAEKEQV